jgi:hypothetical protein
MHETRKTHINCPYCRENGKFSMLYEFVDDGKTFGFICKDGCVSIFDVGYVTDITRGIQLVIASRRDPDYGKYQDGDWLENLIENEDKGIKLHIKSYVIDKINI